MKISFTKTFKPLCLFVFCFLIAGTSQAQPGLIINSPSDLSGIFTDIGGAAFGPQLADLDDITGDLVATNPDIACLDAMGGNSITNGADLAGNIALINRGTCQFQEKTGNAQERGAIAVVICLVDGSDPFNMGGVNDTLTIPAIMITLDLCNQIRVALDEGPVNATLGNPFNLSQSTTAYANFTPCSQIASLDDITTVVTNRTDNVQAGIVATCEITDPDGVVTTLTETVEMLDARTDSIVGFESFLPSAEGTYTVRFFNNGEAIDGYQQGIDEETASFTITEDEFGLDDGGLNPGGISAGEGLFSMGALFFTENDAIATTATFGISNPDTLIGENLTVILYEVVDPTIVIDQNNVETIGFHFYEISETDVSDSLITLPLDNFSSPGDPIPMLADRIYVLMVEYLGNSTFFITSSGNINYPTVASIVVAPDANGATTWFTGGFTSGVTAMLRLGIEAPANGCTVGTNVPELEDYQVTLMPNPANDYVNIALNLTETAPTVQLHLFDVMGRTVRNEVHNNVKDQVFEMDVSNLAAGTYFVSVITDEGRKTLKLSVYNRE